MRLLALSENYPMWDRASGELRYFQLLKSLTRNCAVSICPYETTRESRKVGRQNTERYRRDIESAGVEVIENGVLPTLRRRKFDAVLFEYHVPARHWLADVRFHQPAAVAVVDSVDIQFRRLFSKAAVTGTAEDRSAAEKMKRDELDVYSRADLVITVTEEDRRALLDELPGASTCTIPNIHTVHAIAVGAAERLPDSLVFVGTFKHPPNVEAMLFFAREIFPLVLARRPAAKLRIVGNAPTDEIRALAGPAIEVLGFVPDTAPYLRSSCVSVAPLRFGAGIKGKIGEAMSHGLPVVTTSVGAEGFGLDPGVHAVVADDAAEFAGAIVQLLEDEALRRRIGDAARRFIEEHLSEQAVARLVDRFVDLVSGHPVKQISPAARLGRNAAEWLDRRVLWRMR